VSGIPRGEECPDVELNPSTPVGIVRLSITDVDPEDAILKDVSLCRF
jgi:hypothetical protein